MTAPAQLGSPLELAASFLAAPVVVAAVALTLAWKPWRRGEPVRPGRATAWGAPLALGLGYLAGHVAAHGWPPLALSVGVKQGLFYLALAGLLLGTYEAARRPSVIARVVLSGLAPLFLLDFMWRLHWSGAETVAWLPGLAVGLFAGWSLCEALARRAPGPALLFGWCGALALTAGTLHAAGSSTLAQSAGVLSAVVGVAAALALLRPELTLAGGGIPVLALVQVGLVWAGHFAGELATVPAVLLWTAPVLPALAEWGPLRSRTGPGVRTALRVFLALLPAALALALEIVDRPAPYG